MSYKFKVGTPSSTRGFNPDCQPFEIVSHTSHVETALSILDKGEIRPYLVFDESKLNDQRILVSWLSPNYWSVGFRYGNIKFEFDFNQLIKGKRFYWVESIAYKIPACRILVTDENHDASLEKYDPKSKDGPWWHDITNDKHYFNGNYCLEFMFECSINLTNLKKIDFVDHHSHYCSIHRMSPPCCSELGFNASKGGAMFITRAVASGFSLEELTSYFIGHNNRPNFILENAFSELYRRVLRNTLFNGVIKAQSEEGHAVAHGICSAFSFHQIDIAKKLASLFETERDCESALAIIISETVGLTDWNHLVDVY